MARTDVIHDLLSTIAQLASEHEKKELRSRLRRFPRRRRLDEVQNKSALYALGKYEDGPQDEGSPRPPRTYWCADNLEGKKARWVHEDVMTLEILLGRTYYSTKPGKTKAKRVEGAEVRIVLQSERNETDKDNLDALKMPEGVPEPAVEERPAPVQEAILDRLLR